MDPGELPVVREDARFVDALDLDGRPHAVVDGPMLPGTALALSHWPGATTPAALAADTSAGIVDRYLDAAPAGPELGRVTNNHYDEDGVLALWLLLERPDRNDPRRGLALEAAEAGDFRTWRHPHAARVALALAALAERATTPFPAVLRALGDRSGRDPAGAVTAAVLGRVGALLADPERYRRFWAPGWARVEADLALLDAGAVGIREVPEADLAVVTTPRDLDALALHPRTDASRLLLVRGDGVVCLQDRYETWVRYVSRARPPRVDLAPVAETLQALETRPGDWRYEGVAAMTPRLRLARADGRPTPTGIPAGRVEALVVDALTAVGRARPERR